MLGLPFSLLAASEGTFILELLEEETQMVGTPTAFEELISASYGSPSRLIK